MSGDGGDLFVHRSDSSQLRGVSLGGRVGGLAADPIVQCLALVLGVSIVFAAFPVLDLWFSELFAEHHLGFPLKSVPAFIALGRVGALAVAVALAAMLGSFLWKLLHPERPSLIPPSAVAFLLASLAGIAILTPVLMLAAASKRLAPSDVDLFGGNGAFVPLWQSGGTCSTDCAAFSSASSWTVWLVAAAALAPPAWRVGLSKALAVLAVAIVLNVVATGEDYLSGVVLSGAFAALIVAVAHRVIIERPAERLAGNRVEADLTRLGYAFISAFREADWDAVSRKAQAPWRDRRARLSPLKAITFGLVALPAAWLVWLTLIGELTPLPWVFLIYNTGVWALWLFLASLAVTPARHIFGWPELIAVRRMLGVGGLFFTVLHLADYLWLDRFSAGFIVNEYLTRPTIWVATLATAGIFVLGATSFDETIRRMGTAAWTRLHIIAYPAIGFSVLHFDMSPGSYGGPPFLMTGMFFWLMAWRVLHRYGLATKPSVLALLALVTPLTSFIFEVAWLALYQGIRADKTVGFTFQIVDGLAPTWQLLLLGLTAAALAAIFGRHSSWRGRLRLRPPSERPPLGGRLAAAGARAR